MATDVGSIYLEVFADTKALKAQVRKAAKDAGKSFGKEWGDEAEKSMAPALSRLGKIAGNQMGDSGHMSAQKFGDAFQDGIRERNWAFDQNIVDAFLEGDWHRVFGQFDSLDEAVEAVNVRLRELDKGNGQIKRSTGETGISIGKLRDQMDASAAAIRKTSEETKALVLAEQEASEHAKAWKQEQDRLNKAFETTERVERAMNKERDKATALKAANETKALREQMREAAAETKKYEGEQRRLAATLRNSERESARLAASMRKTAARAKKDGDSFGLFGRTVGNSFDFANRKWKEFAVAMPAGLQFILANLLLVIGPLSTVGSAIGSVLIPLVGALGVAIGGLAAAVAGFGVAAGYAMVLAVKSFDVFKEKFPETQAAIDSLKDSFENVDVPRFAAEWSDSVKRFSQTLADSLRFDQVAEMLGKATAAITDSFTAVLQSPAWTGFVDSIDGVTEGIAGPLANALQGMGTGLAGVFGIALQWMTAAAPLAEHLGDLFSTWATNLNAALATPEGQAALIAFMSLATTTIDALVPLVSNLAQAFNNIFLAGADTGAGFLQTLAGLAAQFNAWTASAEGQAALNQLFEQGKSVFDALIPLLGALGTAFATMVTPDTVQSLIIFMNAITQVLPIFAQLIAAVQQLGVFDLLASLLQIVFTAIQPLIPALASLAGIIGGQLALLFSAFAPILNIVGQLLADLAPVIGTLVSALGGALVTAVQALAPLFAVLAAALVPIADAIIALLVPILPVLGDLLAGAAQVVTALIQALLPLLPVVVLVADILGQVLAASLDAIMPLFGILADTIVALSPIVSMLADVLIALLPAVLPLIINIIELSTAFVPILGLIPPLVKMLMPLVKLIIELSAAFLPLITTVLGFVSDLIPKITELATQLIDGLVGGLNTGITAVTDWITAFVETVLTWFKNLFGIHSPSTVFMDFGTDIIQGLLDGLNAMLAAIGEFFTGLWESISTSVATFLAGFLAFWTALPGQVIAEVSSLVTLVATWITDVMTAFYDNTIGGFVVIGQWFADLPSTVIGLVSGLVTMIGTWAGEVMAGMLSGITTGWTAVSTWFSDLPAKITGLVGTGLTILSTVGSNIVQGLADGISGAWTKVKSAIDGLVAKIPEAARKLLGIESPSKVFRTIGQLTMDGLRVGLAAGSRGVYAMLDGIGKRMAMTRFDVGAPGLNVNPSRGGGNLAAQVGGRLAGANVASGAIQIITPVRDPAIVANMVLDGLVGSAV